MGNSNKNALYFVIIMVICIVILNLPLDRLSGGVLKVMWLCFFPAIFGGYAILLLFQRKKKLDMKKRCIVKVIAECVSMQYHHRFLVKGRFVTAVYAYEYNGIRYTGCNNLDVRSFTRGVIEPGNKAEIFINPYCLPNELYDSIADMSAKTDLHTALALLILSALVVVFKLMGLM